MCCTQVCRAVQDVCELTGELGLPLSEAFLLHGVEVRQVVMGVFEGLLLQTKCGQSPGSIFARKHTIRPL